MVVISTGQLAHFLVVLETVIVGIFGAIRDFHTRCGVDSLGRFRDQILEVNDAFSEVLHMVLQRVRMILAGQQ